MDEPQRPDASPTEPDSPRDRTTPQTAAVAAAAEGRELRSRELAALRDQCQFLRKAVTFLGMLAVLALVTAAIALFLKEVTVKRLTLVSPGGNTKAVLETDGGYPQLVMYDRQGVKRAMYDWAGMLLYGDDGTTMLRELGDASRLEFKRAYNGVETQTWLGNDGKRLQLLMKNKNGVERMHFLLDVDKGAKMTVQDPSGTRLIEAGDRTGSSTDGSGSGG